MISREFSSYKCKAYSNMTVEEAKSQGLCVTCVKLSVCVAPADSDLQSLLRRKKSRSGMKI